MAADRCTPVGTSLDRAAWIEQIGQGGMGFQRADETEELGEDLKVHGTAAATRTTLSRF